MADRCADQKALDTLPRLAADDSLTGPYSGSSTKWGLLTGLTDPERDGLNIQHPFDHPHEPVVPAAVLVLLGAAGLVSVGGFGFVAMAGLSWLYKYI